MDFALPYNGPVNSHGRNEELLTQEGPTESDRLMEIISPYKSVYITSCIPAKSFPSPWYHNEAQLFASYIG